MPTKFLAKLERARLHPGVTLLRDVASGEVLGQFSLSQVKNLLGGRNYGYWNVIRTANAWEFREEIPREDVEVPPDADS